IGHRGVENAVTLAATIADGVSVRCWIARDGGGLPVGDRRGPSVEVGQAVWVGGLPRHADTAPAVPAPCATRRYAGAGDRLAGWVDDVKALRVRRRQGCARRGNHS